MTKQTITFESNGNKASITTGAKDPSYALIGRFNDSEFRVISIHKRAELAKVEDVANVRWTEVQVAKAAL